MSGFLSADLATAAADEPSRSSRSDRDRDRDDDRRSSRRYDDDDRRSSRYEDDRRGGRDRDDYRSSRDSRDSYSSRDRDRRDDRRYDDRRDDRGPPRRDDRYSNGPPRGYDRGPPRDFGGSRGGYGGRGGFGGGRGGGFGGRGREPPAPDGVFGDPIREPTPPGTIPLSQRKRPRTAWDVRAPGFEAIDAWRARMTGRFNLPGQSRTNMGYGATSGMSGMVAGAGITGGTVSGYNPFGTSGPMPEGFGIHSSMPAPPSAQPNALAIDPSGENVPGLAYSRQARRLYVGNITLEATETNVAAFFNAKMREKGFAVDKREGAIDVQAPDPVVSVQVNHDKSYAFVEFRSPDEAQSCMTFDGISFQGQTLKIRRPKDYQGPDATGGFMPSGVQGGVPDSPNKIFIGGLPLYLTEDQVVELLNSFGELRAFNLVKDPNSGASKGFAFCEYVDPSLTDVACAGLNGMELGDRYLVVQRAQNSAEGQKLSEDMTQGMMPGGLAPNAILAAAAPGASAPTPNIQLLNMCDQTELLDDEEYNDIREDIRDECAKYGTVLDINIPRPIVNTLGKIDGRASEAVHGLGRIFVKFDSIEAATKAMAALGGRQFGSRTVLCAYAAEEEWPKA